MLKLTFICICALALLNACQADDAKKEEWKKKRAEREKAMEPFLTDEGKKQKETIKAAGCFKKEGGEGGGKKDPAKMCEVMKCTMTAIGVLDGDKACNDKILANIDKTIVAGSAQKVKDAFSTCLTKEPSGKHAEKAKAWADKIPADCKDLMKSAMCCRKSKHVLVPRKGKGGEAAGGGDDE